MMTQQRRHACPEARCGHSLRGPVLTRTGRELIRLDTGAGCWQPRPPGPIRGAGVAYHYKVSKQADALMLFYLLSADELRRLFRQLGYPFAYETIPKNIGYYLQRTSHGSTLSWVVHSWVLARSDRSRSWRLFTEALESDVSDIQGGTTQEAIHLGAMAGTVDLVQRCYIGIEMRDDVLWLNPCLPEDLQGLSLTIRYRSHWLTLDVTHDKLTVLFRTGWTGTAKVGFRDRIYEFQAADVKVFAL
jgi:trehalose/maltose hydrolase-like predicted phosphorylase